MARSPAEGTRERILGVAAELFYARGVRAVGMSQIIDAAGCGKNLLYSNFPSKTDLVAAYLDAEAQYREQQVQEMLASAGDDPVDQIIALTSTLPAAWQNRSSAAARCETTWPNSRVMTARPPRCTGLPETPRRIDRLARQAGFARPAKVSQRIWLIHDGLYARRRAREPAVASARR